MKERKLKDIETKKKERKELEECIDMCCYDFPLVFYRDGKFEVICKWCSTKISNEDSTKAMIEWNKEIRARKV
ncbi:MAG: hypothetical protein M0P71_01720 [Melioribacteraceae bacterium]|nr:hypothetical protein [Melioribacteraceae bacterium]